MRNVFCFSNTCKLGSKPTIQSCAVTTRLVPTITLTTNLYKNMALNV